MHIGGIFREIFFLEGNSEPTDGRANIRILSCGYPALERAFLNATHPRDPAPVSLVTVTETARQYLVRGTSSTCRSNPSRWPAKHPRVDPIVCRNRSVRLVADPHCEVQGLFMGE